ncbi:histidinol-phosphate aminotransferase [Deinococcus aetherius]|uniref:histidinol-phosphate transaminase n=1 Tax=Deinococcus aetherius TaxID=200252 RepID=A0ABM8A930_9DEIO|nr:histidinol-phosphate transaminase [Deinococcus aetherius]BDP40084.1 histidinol-phosphate aminotransferase [Deinococcus aetherius]
MTDLLPPLLPRAPHGGPTSRPFTGLDFSVNATPYGPNPVLVEAIRAADHAHYPDPTYRDVRARLAGWHVWDAEGVALSVGASDLLHRLARAFLPPGGTLLSVHAPFGELARAAALVGAGVRVTTSERAVAGITPGVSLVYVGHPHNPTGHAHTAEELGRLADACHAAGALLIVDEAYAPFTAAPTLPPHPAVVRVLSPGKAHGLVGARPAYALASPEVAARLDNLAPAWHLPASTAAVLAALPQGEGFLGETLPRVAREARVLAAALSNFGPVEHHGTPYLTLRVGDASRVTEDLLERGVKVRDCASYGLPDRIRVSTRLPEENARLVMAVRDVPGGGRHG